jgi:hypothetical protein
MEENNNTNVSEGTVVPTDAFWVNAQSYMKSLDERNITIDPIAEALVAYLQNVGVQYEVARDLCYKNADEVRRLVGECRAAQEMAELANASLQREVDRSNERARRANMAEDRIESIHDEIKAAVACGEIDTSSTFIQRMQDDFGLRLTKTMELRFDVSGSIRITLENVPLDWEVEDVGDSLTERMDLNFSPTFRGRLGDNDEIEVDVFDFELEVDEISEM